MLNTLKKYKNNFLKVEFSDFIFSAYKLEYLREIFDYDMLNSQTIGTRCPSQATPLIMHGKGIGRSINYRSLVDTRYQYQCMHSFNCLTLTIMQFVFV